MPYTVQTVAETGEDAEDGVGVLRGNGDGVEVSGQSMEDDWLRVERAWREQGENTNGLEGHLMLLRIFGV